MGIHDVPCLTPRRFYRRLDRSARRYLHYYKRYDNHHKAQQYAEKQEEEIERRMMRLQETDGSRWIDVQFLKAREWVVYGGRRGVSLMVCV